MVAEAPASADNTGERLYETELHRLKGELLLQQVPSDASQAERCFQMALVIARRRQAKSLELRAAMCLSRLWCQQGRVSTTGKLLTEVYNWLTEGLGSADLQEAKGSPEQLE